MSLPDLAIAQCNGAGRRASNRLLSATAGGVTAGYNYDPFGRLDTVTSAGQVIERNVYDGFDHVVENRKTTGGSTATTRYTFDPLDRTTTKTTDVGTAEEKTTTFSYLGLSGEVLDEAVAGEITKSYPYSPWGERLSQVTHNSDGTDEDALNGYNQHRIGDIWRVRGRDHEMVVEGLDRFTVTLNSYPERRPSGWGYERKNWDNVLYQIREDLDDVQIGDVVHVYVPVTDIYLLGIKIDSRWPSLSGWFGYQVGRRPSRTTRIRALLSSVGGRVPRPGAAIPALRDDRGGYGGRGRAWPLVALHDAVLLHQRRRSTG